MAYTESQLKCLEGMGIVPWVLRDAQQPEQLPVQPEKQSPEQHREQRGTVEQKGFSQAAEIEPSALSATKPEAVVTSLTQSSSDVALPNDERAEASTSELINPEVLLKTPLVSIQFRGRPCTQLGNPDASFLILVEAVSTQQTQYPFEPADAKIFEDMLRAIAWRRQDVCLAVTVPTHQGSMFSGEQQQACVEDLCRVPRDVVLVFRHQLPKTHNAEELLVPIKEGGKNAWQLPHPALLRESPARKGQAWEVLKAARACLG